MRLPEVAVCDKRLLEHDDLRLGDRGFSRNVGGAMPLQTIRCYLYWATLDSRAMTYTSPCAHSESTAYP